MHTEVSEIRIKNLRLRTFIGFNSEERKKLQDVVVNVQISYDAADAADRDEVGSALDYKRITKQLIAHVENNRFLLLEKLVADLLAIVMSAERVMRASVEVDKPHALRFADSVSVTRAAYREVAQLGMETGSRTRNQTLAETWS